MNRKIVWMKGRKWGMGVFNFNYFKLRNAFLEIKNQFIWSALQNFMKDSNLRPPAGGLENRLDEI